MSLETLSGPQQVTMAAQRMQECPYNADPSATVADMVGDQTHARERLLRFAGLKVLTDELAVRLPNMISKYPPYGLPRIREYKLEGEPEEPDEIIVCDTPLRQALAELKGQYLAKMEVHSEDELAAMADDPRFQHVPKSVRLAKIGIDGGSVNSINTMTGFLAIMPDVLGSETSHDEIVAVARNSKRLPIMPSLLNRQALDAFRIAATEDIPSTSGSTYKQAPWGWAFDPKLFTAYSDSRTHKTYMDYSDGMDSIDITNYWEWEDRRAEEHFTHMLLNPQPGRMPSSVKDSRAPTIGALKEAYSRTLTCPARQLILATWADMVNIADQKRMFERESTD